MRILKKRNKSECKGASLHTQIWHLNDSALSILSLFINFNFRHLRVLASIVSINFHGPVCEITFNYRLNNLVDSKIQFEIINQNDGWIYKVHRVFVVIPSLLFANKFLFAHYILASFPFNIHPFVQVFRKSF